MFGGGKVAEKAYANRYAAAGAHPPVVGIGRYHATGVDLARPADPSAAAQPHSPPAPYRRTDHPRPPAGGHPSGVGVLEETELVPRLPLFREGQQGPPPTVRRGRARCRDATDGPVPEPHRTRW